MLRHILSTHSRTEEVHLASHMAKKCIFVGYPAGYKGWEFYNPVTRKLSSMNEKNLMREILPGIKPTPFGRLYQSHHLLHHPEGREYCQGFMGGMTFHRNSDKNSCHHLHSTVRMPILQSCRSSTFSGNQ